ncbi:MAG TPA: nuclear transport factor 2 family protein [Actinomycetota bacterium]|jgi:hypothetical protein|nr:nuclear transport factor 2 family protein [Actinomycetota bacterium]
MANVALEARVREIIDAFNRRDFETAASMFRDDVIVEFPQSGERISGRENLLGMTEDFDAPTFRVWRMQSSDDLVMAEVVADYPDGGRFLGVSVYRFSGNEVAHETDYFTEPFPPSESRAPFVTLHDMPDEGA